MKKKLKCLPKTLPQFYPSTSTGSLGLLIPFKSKKAKVIPLTNNSSLRQGRLNTSTSSGNALYTAANDFLIEMPDADLDFNHRLNTFMQTLVTVQTKKANGHQYY